MDAAATSIAITTLRNRIRRISSEIAAQYVQIAENTADMLSDISELEKLTCTAELPPPSTSSVSPATPFLTREFVGHY